MVINTKYALGDIVEYAGRDGRGTIEQILKIQVSALDGVVHVRYVTATGNMVAEESITGYYVRKEDKPNE